MDPDAPPLVRADALAAQGEQLSSRKAFQQALSAHNEAARNYQVAAQATSDASVAKVLLMQRNKQLKLVAEVQRKILERNSPLASNNNSKAAATATALAGSRVSAAAKVGTNARDSLPLPLAASTSTSRRGGVVGSQATTGTGVPAYRQPSTMMATSSYSGLTRDSTATPTLADSRYSRKSSSPSASQISSVIPHSSAAGESGRTSSVEDSYYVLRPDIEPADAINEVWARLEALAEELGNPVAFATIPLQTQGVASSDTGKGAAENKPAGSISGHRKGDSTSSGDGSSNAGGGNGVAAPGVQESFYVVPGNLRKLSLNTDVGGDQSSNDAAQQPKGSTKTYEELTHENATLKDTLDTLSKLLDRLQKERQKERDQLRGSITMFARDVRKQAERVMAQSTASMLPDSRRQVPPAPLSAGLHGTPALHEDTHHSALAAQRRIAELQEELKAAKYEAERQTAAAQRYKTRYDDLRKAIVEKRKAKTEAQQAAAAAAAAAAAGSGSAGVPAHESLNASGDQVANGKAEVNESGTTKAKGKVGDMYGMA